MGVSKYLSPKLLSLSVAINNEHAVNRSKGRWGKMARYPPILTSCLVILQVFFTRSNCLAIDTSYHTSYQSDEPTHPHQGLSSNSSDYDTHEQSETATQVVVIALLATTMGTIGLFWLAYICSTFQNGTGQSISSTQRVLSVVQRASVSTSPIAGCGEDAHSVSMQEFDKVAPAVKLSDYQQRKASLMTTASLLAETSYLIWLVLRPS